MNKEKKINKMKKIQRINAVIIVTGGAYFVYTEAGWMTAFLMVMLFLMHCMNHYFIGELMESFDKVLSVRFDLETADRLTKALEKLEENGVIIEVEKK